MAQGVAPRSPQLGKWYSHAIGRWPEFEKRTGLSSTLNPDAWRPIFEAAQPGTATLIYAARDPEHNSAVVLAGYLKSTCTETWGWVASAGSAPSVERGPS